MDKTALKSMRQFLPVFLVAIMAWSCTSDMDEPIINSDSTASVPRLRTSGETTPGVNPENFVYRYTSVFQYPSGHPEFVCAKHSSTHGDVKIHVSWTGTTNRYQPPTPEVMFTHKVVRGSTACNCDFPFNVTSISVSRATGYNGRAATISVDGVSFPVFKATVKFRYQYQTNYWTASDITHTTCIGYSSSNGLIKLPDGFIAY